MTDDLKLIKRDYGEKMMHYCRENFSTILETPGLLYKTIIEHFAPSKLLYDDIKDDGGSFKSYIIKLLWTYDDDYFDSDLLPFELMKKAGYTLYECKTEDHIQSFRHYYYNPNGTPEYKGGRPLCWRGEELCTFNGDRLDRCIVFFAVKANVDEIKREDFTHPMRQDEYGTSVISIQITRDATHTLSIKNRYNHTVDNPDSTFSNDLENIIAGLTSSFEKYLNLKINSNKENFELENYVLAGDSRYYKYNVEKDNIYYCPNNIIIDNFQVRYLDREKYILMDDMLLTLTKPQKIECLSNKTDDFIRLFKSGINRIDIKNNGETKEIVVECIDNTENKIILNNHNRIISFTSNTKNDIISMNFMNNCLKMEELNMPNANIMYANSTLPKLNKCNLNLSNINTLFILDLSHLKSVEKLILPQTMNGNLSLNGLENADGLVLPKIVNGYVDLSNLKNAKGLILPDSIEDFLDLSSLTSTDGLIFPAELTYEIYMDGFTITSENVDKYRNNKHI